MKTPRELLLDRHKGIEPRLHAIREAATLRSRKESGTHGPGVPPSFLGMLLSLRWHLAGISALWLLIAVLNGEPGAGQQVAVQQMSTPPAQRLAALKENRRQVAELLDGGAESAEPVIVPQRRSERRSTILMA